MGVEGAVGQTGVGHERGDAGAVDAVALEPPTGGLDDPPPGRFLVFLAVPGHTPLLVSDDTLPSLLGLIIVRS